MAQGDGFHQRQAQADTTLALGGARQSVKGLKDALRQLIRYTGATVADFQRGESLGTTNQQRHLTGAIAPRIFQQVAHHTSQQLGYTGDQHAGNLHIQGRLGAGAFLGRQTDQIHRFYRTQVRLFCVEAAGEQDLINQLVQLTNVARNFVPCRGAGVVTHQLQAHSDTRQG